MRNFQSRSLNLSTSIDEGKQGNYKYKRPGKWFHYYWSELLLIFEEEIIPMLTVVLFFTRNCHDMWAHCNYVII